MKLALDIDNTISAHPKFFNFLAHAWHAAGGEVHIITARKPSDRGITCAQLKTWGLLTIVSTVQMYPTDYPWPYKNGAEADWWERKHAQWKAEVCKTLGIDALYDDNMRNIRACQSTDTMCFHVTKHGAKQG